MAEKTVSRIGKVVTGLARLVAGDVTGAVPLAEAAAGQREAWRAAGREPEAVLARVVAEQRAAFAAEFRSPAEIDAVEAALAEGDGAVFDRRMLVEKAFTPKGLYVAAPEAVVERLGLTAAAGFAPHAVAYARAVIGRGLEAAIAAGGLYERLEAALAIEAARQMAELRESLASAVPKDLLENLVQQFGHENPRAHWEQLGEFLKAKAEDYKALKARLAALEAADARLGNALAAAEAALGRADFDAAEAILADAEELQQAERTLAEVRKQASIRQARAEAALLKGDADAAAAHFEAAAGFVAPFDPQEGAAIRHAAAHQLHHQGKAFGGRGIMRAIDLYRRNLKTWSDGGRTKNWAMTQNNLANALSNQAERAAGPARAALLEEAVAAYLAALKETDRAEDALTWATRWNNLGNAYRLLADCTVDPSRAELLTQAVEASSAALQILGPTEHPTDWAMAQNNLANALRDKAANAEGPSKAQLLARAVVAFKSTLQVYGKSEAPTEWAQAKNNEAAALHELASEVVGAARASRLTEAVQSYRAALGVQTREKHPVDWAVTQSNLGNVLRDRAAEAEGEQARLLLHEAVGAYREALKVWSRADHPLAMANTQNNLGNALGDLAAMAEGAPRAALLAEAAAAYRAALEIWTQKDNPLDWAMLQNNLGLLSETLGGEASDAAPEEYAKALRYFDNALEVFRPQSFPWHCGVATGHRERVAAKLAGLG